MSEPIETLEIKIQGDSSSAEKALAQTAKSIENLSKVSIKYAETASEQVVQVWNKAAKKMMPPENWADVYSGHASYSGMRPGNPGINPVYGPFQPPNWAPIQGPVFPPRWGGGPYTGTTPGNLGGPYGPFQPGGGSNTPGPPGGGGAALGGMLGGMAGFAVIGLIEASLLLLKGSLDKIMEATSSYEMANVKLEAVLKGGNRDVQNLNQNYHQFADTMANTTLQSRLSTLQLLQHAEALGLTGDKAKRAVQESIALSSGRGINPLTALRAAVSLEEGAPDALLSRYLPALRAVQGDANKAALAHQLLNNMFRISTEEIDTATGQWTKFKQSIYDTAAAIGDVFLPAFKSALEGVKGFFHLDQIKEFFKWIKNVGSPEGRLTSHSTNAETIAQQDIYDAELSKMQGITNPDERRKMGEDAIASQLEHIDALDEKIKKAKSNLDEKNGLWGRIAHSDAIVKAKDDLQALQNQADAARAHVGEMRKELEKLPGVDQKKIEDYYKRATEHAATVGMTPGQAQVTKFIMEGASPEQLDRARSAARIDDNARLAESVHKLNKSLYLSIRTMNMTSDAAAIFKLRFEGANAATLAFAQALSYFKNIAENNKNFKKTSEDLQDQILSFGQTSEAAKAFHDRRKGLTTDKQYQEQLEQGRKLNAMKQIKELEDKFKSPAERFAEEQERLERLKKRGLKPELFDKAMDDAYKQAHRDSGLHSYSSGIQGVESGTTQAYDLMVNHERAIANVMPPIVDKKKAGLFDDALKENSPEARAQAIREADQQKVKADVTAIGQGVIQMVGLLGQIFTKPPINIIQGGLKGD